MSIDDVIGISWLVGAAVLYYPAAHVIAHTNPFSEAPDRTDWVIAAVVGAVAAFMWPVLVVVTGSFMVSKRLWTGSWRLPWTPISQRSSTTAEETE